MYLEHWRLKEMPFENAPNPRFFYYSSNHEEALTRMLYVIKNRKGAGALTGVFGCGKTLIGQTLLKELTKEKYKIAFVTNPRLDDVDLLRMIAYHLGAVEPPEKKADVLITLSNILINNIRDGKENVIIVDEAHCIEHNSIFEELRLLLNFQDAERFLLTLLLFGQPELLQKIETNQQLNQRVFIKCHLGNFTLEETKEYIYHRLRVAGLEEQQEIFDKQAIEYIHNYSGGIPRKINHLCDMALFVGYCEHIDKVLTEIIEKVTKDLVS